MKKINPRWINVDPLSELRANVSPYQYVQNNPINAIDPTGMLDESFYKGSDRDASMRMRGENMAIENATWRMSFWDNYYNNAKLVPFGTRVEDSKGNVIGTPTIEGYNLVQSDRGNIHINGNKEFTDRAMFDINVLSRTITGLALLNSINGRPDYQINIFKASAWSPITWNPSPTVDLQESATFLETATDPMGRVTSTGVIRVRYAQHWDVLYDGALTRSYLTLAHELQHVLDIIYGETNRMNGERKAVGVENAIRRELKINGQRTKYHGKDL